MSGPLVLFNSDTITGSSALLYQHGHGWSATVDSRGAKNTMSTRRNDTYDTYTARTCSAGSRNKTSNDDK